MKNFLYNRIVSTGFVSLNFDLGGTNSAVPEWVEPDLNTDILSRPTELNQNRFIQFSSVAHPYATAPGSQSKD
jgi:hypothetical protein